MGLSFFMDLNPIDALYASIWGSPLKELFTFNTKFLVQCLYLSVSDAHLCTSMDISIFLQITKKNHESCLWATIKTA